MSPEHRAPTPRHEHTQGKSSGKDRQRRSLPLPLVVAGAFVLFRETRLTQATGSSHQGESLTDALKRIGEETRGIMDPAKLHEAREKLTAAALAKAQTKELDPEKQPKALEKGKED